MLMLIAFNDTYQYQSFAACPHATCRHAVSDEHSDSKLAPSPSITFVKAIEVLICRRPRIVLLRVRPTFIAGDYGRSPHIPSRFRWLMDAPSLAYSAYPYGASDPYNWGKSYLAYHQNETLQMSAMGH